jgi:hypothetical protein
MKVSGYLETIILGDEYDNALHDALRLILISADAVKIDSSWAVGGSQEIERVQIRLGGDLVTIESETYVGLSIFGPKLVIDEIAKQVRLQLRS